MHGKHGGKKQNPLQMWSSLEGDKAAIFQLLTLLKAWAALYILYVCVL